MNVTVNIFSRNCAYTEYVYIVYKQTSTSKVRSAHACAGIKAVTKLAITRIREYEQATESFIMWLIVNVMHTHLIIIILLIITIGFKHHFLRDVLN